MDSHYKTTDDRGINGHSLGGVFAEYCLLTEHTLFRRYGIHSSGVWSNPTEQVTLRNAFADRYKNLNAQVFLSVGGLETTDLAGMKSLTVLLNQQRGKGLTVTSLVFPDETHKSVIPAGLSRTLRVLYSVKK